MLEAVIGWIGIEENACGSVFLRQKGLDASKALAVAHQNNLAVDVDLGLLQAVKVLWSAVVCIYHFGFDISGRRHAVECRCDAGIVLKRVACHLLRRRAVHLHVRRRGDVHANLLRIVHPHAVFDNFRFQASLAEFLSDVLRRRLVLGGTRDVRGLGQGAKMRLGKSCIRDGEKLRFDLPLACGVAKAEQIGIAVGHAVLREAPGRDDQEKKQSQGNRSFHGQSD